MKVYLLTYFQHCRIFGGELVTIMNSSKQRDVKQFVKNLVVDGKTPYYDHDGNLFFDNRFIWSIADELNFWIGRHSQTNWTSVLRRDRHTVRAPL